MKFLCDRCKTRYSIADERVRGKILKIRCKNCSNVISVREGMPEPEPEAPAVAEARRQLRPTDYAPSVVGGAGPGKPAPVPSLQAAFAQAMEKPAAPPQQLEEEWYVSLDGDQSGPYALADAQAWVRGKKAEEELFCWCEGFDDWLPIEKVSHFRGLRKKAAPRPQPPAAPRPTPPPMKIRPAEEEPTPLFAAALAALEAEVARPDTQQDSMSAAPVAAPLSTARSGRATGSPAVAAQLPPPRPASVSVAPAPSQLAKATPMLGTPKASSLFDAFDADESDGATLPAPPMAVRAPVSLADLARSTEPAAKPTNGHAAELARTAPPAADGEDFDGDGAEDDFQIGEVSRVVRLQDVLAGPGRKKATGGAAAIPNAQTTTGPVNREVLQTAAAPASALAVAAASSLHDDVHGVAPATDAPVALAPVAVARNKRKHTAVIVAGGAALLAVIGLVIFLASSGDDDDSDGSHIGGSGGDVEGLGLTPDDPRFPNRAGTKVGTGAVATDPIAKIPRTPRNPRTGTGSTNGTGGGTNGNGPGTGKSELVIGPDGQPVEPLTPDDVVSQAQRNASGTQRCYERALKKDPFIKVKSIAALITIGKDGKVASVSLDQMSAEPLGVCLIAAIKRWPFRHSTEGINTKITLKFEQTLGP
jgi:predicted Zn finger-like uncharacterized protein